MEVGKAVGELSDRFAALMARMATSDAELFRTVGEQNASIRQMVDELAVADQLTKPPNRALDLPAAGLLPAEQCELKALKARFGKLAEAQSWLENQLGKAPKKPTWALIEQACRQGNWPVASTTRGSAAKALTASQLDERLSDLEQRLEQRLQGMEGVLHLIAKAVLQGR
jgi:hypothetical protein